MNMKTKMIMAMITKMMIGIARQIISVKYPTNVNNFSYHHDHDHHHQHQHQHHHDHDDSEAGYERVGED